MAVKFKCKITLNEEEMVFKYSANHATGGEMVSALLKAVEMIASDYGVELDLSETVRVIEKSAIQPGNPMLN